MNYLEDIYRLKYVTRYSNMPRLKDESVAEHGFFVGAILFELHQQYEFDLGEAMIIAIAHDMTEIELNDCPHVIKQKYPAIAKAYEECEEDVAKELPPMAALGARAFDVKQKCLEAKMVHLADALQCVQYASNEVQLGNVGRMKDIYYASLNRVSQMREELTEYERED